MRALSIGTRAPEVIALQRLLNKAGSAPALAEDGVFGPRTQAAIVAFKTRSRITPVNGTVDATLWSRLGLRIDVTHPMQLYGQPTGMTCWSAAATMMGGNVQSVGPGGATVNPGGGMSMVMDDIETFVRSRGWRMVNNQTRPGMSTLAPLLQRRPLWLAFEGGHFQHAVVASGLWGDGTDEGTVMRIHDPWPPGQGAIYGTTYVDRTVALRSVSPPARAMIQYAAQ